MYILFEKRHSDSGENFYEYDCMGMVDNEAEAMEWRNANLDYRQYKYCPDRKPRGFE